MNIDKLLQSGRNNFVKGDFTEAERAYRKILKVQPRNAGVHYELGNVLREKGQLDEAIVSYKKALQFDPQFPGSYNNLGNVLRKKGQLNEAIRHFQKAITLAPDYAGSYYNLAQALHEDGNSGEAIAYYRKALQIDPNLGNAYFNLGNALQETGQLEDAANNYHKALQISPSSSHVCNNLGNTLLAQGKLNEAESSYKRALHINPEFFSAYSNLLMLMNYRSRAAAPDIFSEHVRFARTIAGTIHSTVLPSAQDFDSRRLRIGYVSPDFRRHAVAYFIEPVIIAHNKDLFEIFCYSNSLKHDKVTERIQQNADQWRKIAGMSDDEVTELIREDGIHILVDLTGHTAHNRILMFARKPAPVQVSWIGYLSTTGLTAIDYKLTDKYADPPGLTEQFYTEKLMRLTESFLCYLPDHDSPEVKNLPALVSGHITFGSFNNFTKVNPEVVTLWAEILKSIPDSRLLLKWMSFHDNATCQYALNLFAQRGIPAGRIILHPSDPAPKHLESYNQVDIGLDTFPFNGAATTCEALWMGVPVITLAGIAYHSRVGASLLSNVGIPGFVAGTPDEYISTAISLARDLERLKFLRSHLRDMMRNSPLCDAKRFTANLESCYRTMWETWCRSV